MMASNYREANSNNIQYTAQIAGIPRASFIVGLAYMQSAYLERQWKMMNLETWRGWALIQFTKLFTSQLFDVRKFYLNFRSS